MQQLDFMALGPLGYGMFASRAISAFSPLKLSEIRHRQSNDFNVGYEHGQQKSTDSAYSSPTAHGSAYEMYQVPR